MRTHRSGPPKIDSSVIWKSLFQFSAESRCVERALAVLAARLPYITTQRDRLAIARINVPSRLRANAKGDSGR
ncbi:hypothetical protein PUN4_1070051 [Paraburkholderia unamae]|nr:hypothetical protein PUN4_1070051 [Paraburkholderia unamae]